MESVLRSLPHGEEMAHLGFKPIACAGGDLEELGEDYNPLLPNRALAPTFQRLSTFPRSPMWGPQLLAYR